MSKETPKASDLSISRRDALVGAGAARLRSAFTLTVLDAEGNVRADASSGSSSITGIYNAFTRQWPQVPRKQGSIPPFPYKYLRVAGRVVQAQSTGGGVTPTRTS